MAKRSSPSQYYVFKQNLINTEHWNDIEVNLLNNAEAAKESSWYEFWLTQGNGITLNEWKIKYKDYIDENVCDQEADESIKVQTTLNENTQIVQTDIVEVTKTWQELWDEHASSTYAAQYSIFEDIYANYCWNLKEAYQEVPKIKSSDESEHIIEINDELELLRLAGLPTAFGKGKNKTQRKRNKNPTQSITAIESSATSSSESEYLSFDSSEEESEMPPVKKQNKTNENQLDAKEETSNVADKHEMHKIANKAIGRRKSNKKNAVLCNVPQFMVEEKSMLKYWKRRFQLFSRFDDGIKLDRESWFSVTPEKVAEHMAKRMACDVIIDGFCGSGGNAIQFAMTCKKVIAIDIDSTKIEMARHNASIYGVADKIEFITGDFLEFCKNGQLNGDVVFLSPPWGGPKYMKLDEYDIENNLEPVGATELIQLARKLGDNIGFFLPRNSKMKQIIRLAGSGNKCEVEHNYLGTRLIGLTAFFGEHFLQNS